MRVEEMVEAKVMEKWLDKWVHIAMVWICYALVVSIVAMGLSRCAAAADLPEEVLRHLRHMKRQTVKTVIMVPVTPFGVMKKPVVVVPEAVFAPPVQTEFEHRWEDLFSPPPRR